MVVLFCFRFILFFLKVCRVWALFKQTAVFESSALEPFICVGLHNSSTSVGWVHSMHAAPRICSAGVPRACYKGPCLLKRPLQNKWKYCNSTLESLCLQKSCNFKWNVKDDLSRPTSLAEAAMANPFNNSVTYLRPLVSWRIHGLLQDLNQWQMVNLVRECLPDLIVMEEIKLGRRIELPSLRDQIRWEVKDLQPIAQSMDREIDQVAEFGGNCRGKTQTRQTRGVIERRRKWGRTPSHRVEWTGGDLARRMKNK